jgi:hypothetical protein
MNDRPAQFKYVAPDGTVIATGSLEFLNKQLAAHKTAEGAIRAAALAADTRFQARADALAQERAEFEAEKKAHDAAVMAGQIRRFVDGVAEAGRRLDAFQRAQDGLRSPNCPTPTHPKPTTWRPSSRLQGQSIESASANSLKLKTSFRRVMNYSYAMKSQMTATLDKFRQL